MWSVHLSNGVKTYEEVLELASPLRKGLRAELDEAFDVFAEQRTMYTRATADDALMVLPANTRMQVSHLSRFTMTFVSVFTVRYWHTKWVTHWE